MTPPQTIATLRAPARSIEQVLTSRWARLLIPSLSDLFFLAILVWLFMSSGAAGWQGLLRNPLFAPIGLRDEPAGRVWLEAEHLHDLFGCFHVSILPLKGDKTVLDFDVACYAGAPRPRYERQPINPTKGSVSFSASGAATDDRRGRGSRYNARRLGGRGLRCRRFPRLI